VLIRNDWLFVARIHPPPPAGFSPDCVKGERGSIL
jgi:hypothetical protein